MDLPRLEQILSYLHTATGLDAAIIDKNMRVLARRHSGLDFCTYIHGCGKCLSMCAESDNSHLALVDKNCKIVSYLCPFGLYEAIAPICRNGKVIAYLFLSVALPEDSDDSESLARVKAAAPGLDTAHLEHTLLKIPRKSAAQLEAYSGILAMAANYIENNDLLSGPEQSLGQLAKNYIKNNLDQKITLSELSYRLGCSTVTLTTRFKEEFGETVMEYVLRKRMALARQMLLENTWNVETVAERCGYQDPGYFTKCFKQYMGLTPQVWKKQNKA